MTKFYMMVGIPGSGKSKIAQELGVKVYSSDKLRKELWGSEEIQGDNNEIFTELYRRIKASLKNGESCVLDATNIKASKRAHFLKEIKNICFRRLRITFENRCFFIIKWIFLKQNFDSGVCFIYDE